MKSLASSPSAPVILVVGMGLVLCLVMAPGAAAQEVDQEEVMERGRTATDWFYDGELEKILELGLTDEMRQAMPDLEAWQRVYEQVTSQLGDEIEVVNEEVTDAQGVQVYLRTVHFAGTGDRPVIVQWAFDHQWRVAGFYVTPRQQ